MAVTAKPQATPSKSVHPTAAKLPHFVPLEEQWIKSELIPFLHYALHNQLPYDYDWKPPIQDAEALCAQYLQEGQIPVPLPPNIPNLHFELTFLAVANPHLQGIPQVTKVIETPAFLLQFFISYAMVHGPYKLIGRCDLASELVLAHSVNCQECGIKSHEGENSDQAHVYPDPEALGKASPYYPISRDREWKAPSKVMPWSQDVQHLQPAQLVQLVQPIQPAQVPHPVQQPLRPVIPQDLAFSTQSTVAAQPTVQNWPTQPPPPPPPPPPPQNLHEQLAAQRAMLSRRVPQPQPQPQYSMTPPSIIPPYQAHAYPQPQPQPQIQLAPAQENPSLLRQLQAAAYSPAESPLHNLANLAVASGPMATSGPQQFPSPLKPQAPYVQEAAPIPWMMAGRGSVAPAMSGITAPVNVNINVNGGALSATATAGMFQTWYGPTKGTTPGAIPGVAPSRQAGRSPADHMQGTSAVRGSAVGEQKGTQGFANHPGFSNITSNFSGEFSKF